MLHRSFAFRSSAIRHSRLAALETCIHVIWCIAFSHLLPCILPLLFLFLERGFCCAFCPFSVVGSCFPFVFGTRLLLCILRLLSCWVLSVMPCLACTAVDVAHTVRTTPSLLTCLPVTPNAGAVVVDASATTAGSCGVAGCCFSFVCAIFGTVPDNQN